jgi:molybdopterin/thiamine biosynthesis adenylyltransferase
VGAAGAKNIRRASVGTTVEIPRTMTESSRRFLDFDKIDVVAMSEYVLHNEREPRL